MTTRYAREARTFTQAEIDALVAEGTARSYSTLIGQIYVVKLAEGGSIKVTADQIVAPVVEDDNAAEAWLADQDELDYLRSKIVDHDTEVDYLETLCAKADAQGVSVEELTDGEYSDPRPKTKAEQLDEIAAFFY
ncbi:hypothetical protein SEA_SCOOBYDOOBYDOO_45 [Mycobacterium phage ScoobyDoobyDoo]|nr:hypothetical protein SEA_SCOOBYDOOBYDOO_45 [Mycobacterium phage ScoobyDoobyDoo]